jgi:hypothetical protein
MPVPNLQTAIAGTEFRGIASLSRNGRFALVWEVTALGTRTSMVDISTGERFDRNGCLYAWPRYGRRPVTSDGVGLGIGPGELRLFRVSGSTTVSLQDDPLEAVIDDAGRTVVYEATQPGPDGRKLVLVDLARGVGQIFVMETGGTGWRQVTSDVAGIVELVASGDGKVAYAVTGAGRLLRIDVEAGAAVQIIGRTPVLAPPALARPYPVPGPLSRFTVGALQIPGGPPPRRCPRG